jgi:hypothetical protein
MHCWKYVAWSNVHDLSPLIMAGFTPHHLQSYSLQMSHISARGCTTAGSTPASLCCDLLKRNQHIIFHLTGIRGLSFLGTSSNPQVLHLKSRAILGQTLLYWDWWDGAVVVEQSQRRRHSFSLQTHKISVHTQCCLIPQFRASNGAMSRYQYWVIHMSSLDEVPFTISWMPVNLDTVYHMKTTQLTDLGL